jgi:hypothetical protein
MAQPRRSTKHKGALKARKPEYKKRDFPVWEVRRFLEPGPIVLVTSAWRGETNITLAETIVQIRVSPTKLKTLARHDPIFVASSHDISDRCRSARPTFFSPASFEILRLIKHPLKIVLQISHRQSERMNVLVAPLQVSAPDLYFSASHSVSQGSPKEITG